MTSLYILKSLGLISKTHSPTATFNCEEMATIMVNLIKKIKPELLMHIQPEPISKPPAPTPTLIGNFKKALHFTLNWEGGFSDNPNDYGGRTNKGITQTEYNSYCERNGLAKKDVKYITDTEVEDIYFADYWKSSKAINMEWPLCLVHFDTAVNFGIGGATTFVQEALDIKMDGQWGSQTQKAFDNFTDKKKLAGKIIDGRINYRYNRVNENPSQQIFLAGWLNRDNALKKEYLL